VYGRVYANGVRVVNNTWSASCGADSTAAAVHFDGMGGAGFATGNYVTGNLFESTGYVYVCRVSNNAPRNLFIGNTYWDAAGPLLAYHYLDSVTAGNLADTFIHMVDDTHGASTKWVVDLSGAARYTLMYGGRILGTGQLNSQQTYASPLQATGSESSQLFVVARSNAEATFPNGAVLQAQQSGKLFLGDSTWSTTAGLVIKNTTGGQTTLDNTSLVKNTGVLDIYAGTGSTDAVRIARNNGLLKLGIAGTSVTISSGTGVPGIAGALGDRYFRSDTPSTANQRDYICTVAGAAGVATWVGYA
jgi:hypothetical protein